MNSVLRVFRYACWLVVLAVLALARVALAGDPPPKLEADLIHLKNYPAHVVTDDEDDLLGYSWARLIKAKVLPRVKSPCAILPEPVFEISSSTVVYGLAMPPGSHALYSPKAELVYIESTPADVDLVRTALSPTPTREHALWSMDILLELKSAERTETLLEVKSMPFQSGQRMELGATGLGRVQLILEPIVFGPEEDEFHLSMEANVQANGKSLKREFIGKMKRSKPEPIELGMLGNATVTLRLTTHLEIDYFGPPVLETDAKKATAIEEIQKALRKVPAR